MEPIVGPEQSSISISHNCVRGCSKESFDWLLHLNREGSPRFVRLSFFLTITISFEVPSTKILDHESPDHQVRVVELLSAKPASSDPLLHLSFLAKGTLYESYPWPSMPKVAVLLHGKVDNHGGHNKSNLYSSTGSIHKVCFPSR